MGKPKSKPKPDEEQITDALSDSGTFLQINTAFVLHKAGFLVRWEYPVVVAPFINNPIDELQARHMNKPQNKEFLQVLDHSRNFNRQEETSIDIIATKTFGKFEFILCIEVKKRHPTYVKWVFLEQHKHGERLKAPIISLFDKGPILLKVPELFSIGNELFVRLNNEYSGRFPSELFPMFDYARALKRDKNQKLDVEAQFYHAEETDVDKACRQICKGTYGLLLDKIYELVTPTSGYDNTVRVFIPIVVTNADILACEYDIAQISATTGRPLKPPTYKAINSLVYYCNPPDVVRFPMPNVGEVDIDMRRYLMKWQVYIMNTEGLVEFLNYLNRAW